MQDATPMTRVMKCKLGSLMLRLSKGDWHDLSIEEWQICRVAEQHCLAFYIEPVQPPPGPVTWEVMEQLRIASRTHRDHFKLTKLGLEVVHGNTEKCLRAGKYKLLSEKTIIQKAGDWVLQLVGKLPSLVQVKTG